MARAAVTPNTCTRFAFDCGPIASVLDTTLDFFLISTLTLQQQDGAYFEFKKHSLCATLNYTIETSVRTTVAANSIDFICRQHLPAPPGRARQRSPLRCARIPQTWLHPAH